MARRRRYEVVVGERSTCSTSLQVPAPASGRATHVRMKYLCGVPACAGECAQPKLLTLEPQIRRDYPPNLRISISGGKETNKYSLSNGERSGKSLSLKSLAVAVSELWQGEAA